MLTELSDLMLLIWKEKQKLASKRLKTPLHTRETSTEQLLGPKYYTKHIGPKFCELSVTLFLFHRLRN